MMQRMIRWQEKSELFCFIASYHAQTTLRKGGDLKKNTLEAARDFLALGLDPQKSVFWVQSDVPEVHELAWILAQSITVPQLELGHSYKDKVSAGAPPGAGLFFYPVLMAADILGFRATSVPVGRDQKQHLEMARDICRRFNNEYGELFILPEADIAEDVALVPGIDGRKMSKSYNNTISVFGTKAEIKKQVMSITTDSKGMDEPKSREGPLYEIFQLFLDESARSKLDRKLGEKGVGYGHLKQDLLSVIEEHFADCRKRREALSDADVRAIMAEGATRARSVIRPVLDEARAVTGLAY